MNRHEKSELSNLQCHRLHNSVDAKIMRAGRVQGEKNCATDFQGLSAGAEVKNQWFGLDYRPDLHVAVVLPGLLLGAQDTAQELFRLRNLGVTHILNLATGIPNCFPQEITYKRVDLRDHPDTDIRKHFEECFRFIDGARRQGWVLVHCNAGISRAATIAIGYVMSRENCRYEEAFRRVKQARPIISPNYGFIQQLKAYEKELFG